MTITNNDLRIYGIGLASFFVGYGILKIATLYGRLTST